MQSEQETEKILEWYHLYKNGVYGYIFTFVRNHSDTEDILQTVFLALLNLGVKTRKIKYPKSYIFRMARNEALRIIKFKSRETVEESFLLDIHGENNIEDFVDKDEVQAVLNQLTIEEREILIMRVYEKMTFKEIATVTNRITPSITTKYYRAIKKAKNFLENIYENK